MEDFGYSLQYGPIFRCEPLQTPQALWSDTTGKVQVYSPSQVLDKSNLQATIRVSLAAGFQTMATQTQLRQYLAQWFQLGKGVKIAQDETHYCPRNIAFGSDFSPEFEAHWQKFQQVGLERCHLEDTSETLAELSQADWDIKSCARCDMPVALKVGGITPLDCPCSKQHNWPNLELPTPQLPQDWNERIRDIGRRLKEK